MRMIAAACAATLLALTACQKSEDQPPVVDATPAPPAGDSAGSTADPSGAAPPQPNPNGGDTPVGAAGPGGTSPNAAEAVNQGDPQTPGMTAPPK
jgi:hypothetical protein